MPNELDSFWFGEDELYDHCSDLEDRQLIRDAQNDVDDQAELSPDTIQTGFDTDCYYISKSAKQGIITCRLRKREELRVAAAIVAARSELRKIPPSKFLYSSVSFTLSLYPFVECLRRATQWMHWRRRWVYGSEVGIELDDIYPTRSVLQRRDTRLAAHRPGDERSKSSWEYIDSSTDGERDAKRDDISIDDGEQDLQMSPMGDIVDDDFRPV